MGVLLLVAGCGASAGDSSATSGNHGKPFECPSTTSGQWAPSTPASEIGPTGSHEGESVRIVGYSVPKPAYDALSEAFVKTPAGRGVDFTGSYGASGTQSKAVSRGQQADYVTFSVGSDLSRLVPSKVATGWDSGPTKGMVSDSVVVIAVREGNPKHICGWDDLVKPGVEIVTPDPASSGSAKWNILAAYEHVLLDGGTPAAAKAYLKKFYDHIAVRAASGAVATTQFTAGTGDVLISYENEVIHARQTGASMDYVIPAESFLIENPAAVTKQASPAAKAFLSYARSKDGQAIFAEHGYRPVVAGIEPGPVKGANDPNNPFPTPRKLATITQLGGWDAVNEKFFGENGIVTEIQGG